MALNLTRFAGQSKISGQAVFLGAVDALGRVWKAEDNTETFSGNGAARDIQARQAAGVPALTERNQP